MSTNYLAEQALAIADFAVPAAHAVRERGVWVQKSGPVDEAGAHEHVEGRSTLGVYAFEPGSEQTRIAVCSWTFAKGQEEVPAAVRSALRATRSEGLSIAAFGTSNRRHYRILFLWDTPQRMVDVRAYLLALMPTATILPDVDRASDDAPGGVIEIPIGGERGELQLLNAGSGEIDPAPVEFLPAKPVPQLPPGRVAEPPPARLAPAPASEVRSSARDGNPTPEWLAKLARHMCRTTHWRKGPKYPRHVKRPLEYLDLKAHLGDGPAIGLAPITPGRSTTRAALVDLDAHKEDEANWDEMVTKAAEVMRALEARGMSPFAFRSSGGRGIHIYLLWKEEQDAYSVQQLLEAALADCGLKHGAKGIKAGDAERFPKQDSVAAGDAGSMWILPGHGASVPLDPKTLAVGDLASLAGVDWPISPAVPTIERPAKTLPATSAAGSADLADLKSALAAIPNEGDQALDYDTWFDTVAGIHFASGGSEEGRALAHEFSSRASKYVPEFLDDRVWQYLKTNRPGGKVITERSIFDRARKHGWIEPVLDDFEDLDQAAGEVVGEAAAPDVHGITDLDASTSTAQTSSKLSRFPAYPASEFIKQAAPTWIIKGWIPRAELVFIIGESGSGKSFLALEMAMSIARGLAWHGKRVKKGKVAYLAAEGAGGFRNRLVAFHQHRDPDLEGLSVVSAAPNLLQKDDVKDLITDLRKLGRLDILVVDTLAQVSPGGDENSFEDTSRVLGHCKAIRKATGATILLVHHVGKTQGKGARGHSSMHAAADAVIEISRQDAIRYAKITKMKDGQDDLTFAFRLNTVQIGVDEDGDGVTSCVVEELEEQPGQGRPAPKSQLQQLVLETVHAQAEFGEKPVPVESIVDAVEARLPPAAPGKRNNRRRDARRALDALVMGRYVRRDGEGVVPC